MAALDRDSIRLYNAGYNGDIDTVNDLLATGVNTNFTAGGGFTPLLVASERGHTAIVQALLDHGANVEAATSDGATSLIRAASGGHTAVVQALLDHGANVDAETTKTKLSSLLIAAIEGHYEVVVALLHRGASINGQAWTGGTPLSAACQEGHLACAQLLIDSGADIEMPNNDGARPLTVAASGGRSDVIEMLIVRGAQLNQGDNDGRTALMFAAEYGHDDCIITLLAAGALADQEDNKGDLAVSYALKEKLYQTSLLLLERTNFGGNKGASILRSICKMGMESVAVKFLEMLNTWDEKEGPTQDEGWKLNILKSGLVSAAEFGEDKIALKILQEVKEENQKKKMCKEVLKLAVESDQGPIVEIITHNISEISSDVVDIALLRKVPSVNDVLIKVCTDADDRRRLEAYTTACLMEKAKKQMENIRASTRLFHKVPKSTEIPYFNFNTAFVGLLVDDAVRIDTAIRELKAPEVHLEGCSEYGCHHHQTCRRFIEAKTIIDDVLGKLGDEIDIFKGTYGKMVGSIIEKSRVGMSDEIDVLVQLRSSLAENFVFNKDTQQVTVNFSQGRRAILEPYTGENNVFDGIKFYEDYIKTVFKIMENYEIPASCPLSRESLHISMTYEPCMRCVDIKHGDVVFMRCEHSNRNEPTVCHSKVGIVLHLGWRRNENEWAHRIDIDLTVPKLPTRDKCEGKIHEIQEFLRQNKLVGWLEEYRKLMDTEAAAGGHHLANPSTIWLVQMRKINNRDIIPRQMVNFMNEKTLKGSKLELYILLKILKNITNSDVKSFTLKFAVRIVLMNTVPALDEIGEAALKVLNFKTLRGQFGGIAPELKALGYTKVDLNCLRNGEIKLIRKEESSPSDECDQQDGDDKSGNELAGSSNQVETRVEDSIPSSSQVELRVEETIPSSSQVEPRVEETIPSSGQVEPRVEESIPSPQVPASSSSHVEPRMEDSITSPQNPPSNLEEVIHQLDNQLEMGQPLTEREKKSLLEIMAKISTTIVKNN